MHSSGFFRIKFIAKLILKREISGSHTISDQSLLLSTNILNDSNQFEACLVFTFHYQIIGLYMGTKMLDTLLQSMHMSQEFGHVVHCMYLTICPCLSSNSHTACNYCGVYVLEFLFISC